MYECIDLAIGYRNVIPYLCVLCVGGGYRSMIVYHSLNSDRRPFWFPPADLLILWHVAKPSSNQIQGASSVVAASCAY